MAAVEADSGFGGDLRGVLVVSSGELVRVGVGGYAASKVEMEGRDLAC